jgi:DNA integrity scanning protein DisA with diadenylate cyclase activity
MKKYILVIILILTNAITAFFFKDYGSKTEIVECQEKEIKTQNVVNETVQKAVKRRKVNAIIPIADVWDKLFKKYCSDCTKPDTMPSDLLPSNPLKKGS